MNRIEPYNPNRTQKIELGAYLEDISLGNDDFIEFGIDLSELTIDQRHELATQIAEELETKVSNAIEAVVENMELI